MTHEDAIATDKPAIAAHSKYGADCRLHGSGHASGIILVAVADDPSDSDQTNNAPPTHRARRPRYPGTHPRRFEERYKELDPAAFPEMQAHIRDSGRTPAGTHVPILVDEVLAALEPKPGDVVADCTLGYGGHAEALLRRIGPAGRLFGFDVDRIQLQRTTERLRPFDAYRPCHRNFAGIDGVLRQEGLDGFDVIFADLGVSSMQVDDPVRGFSYKLDGPLDMRMDPRLNRTAADLLAKVAEADLCAALRDLADEPDAAAVAAAIARRRSTRPIATTAELSELVLEAKGWNQVRWRARVASGTRGAHPAARTFQALRMLVNDEPGALRQFLRIAPYCLRPGGRIGVISFHSGEDRLVKRALRDGMADGTYASASDSPIRAAADERRSNPRSSAAKFRWAVRSRG